jgi:hypothetical protein
MSMVYSAVLCMLLCRLFVCWFLAKAGNAYTPRLWGSALEAGLKRDIETSVCWFFHPPAQESTPYMSDLQPAVTAAGLHSHFHMAVEWARAMRSAAKV